MPFSAIIVIGNGSLLISCLKFLKQNTSFRINCIEPETKPFSNLESTCRLLNIEYQLIDNRKALHSYFESISVHKLVLSIHNSYIFSKKAVDNKYLRIINFHNSLLPKHPGRNAPTWAIYEMDEQAGITWHEVVAAVDKGEIICQRTSVIHSQMTGIELTRTCAQLGLKSLKEIFHSLISDNYPKVPQIVGDSVKMHFSNEVPNEGVFEKNWPLEKMSAFLRSLDYGGLPIFEKPKIFHNERWYSIQKYFIQPDLVMIQDSNQNTVDTVRFSDDDLMIQLQLEPLVKL